MILIPEIQTVVILVPRTASGSTRREIMETYPRAMQIYRHMEADGVPAGYDRWQKVGVIRHPIERLWSLYKFLQNFNGDYPKCYIERVRQSALCSFDDYIMHNLVPFTTPYDSAGSERFYPEYSVRHPLPENRKSQYFYLRPDLGTTVYRFDELYKFADRLGIRLNKKANTTEELGYPVISNSAYDHMKRFFLWDFEAARN